MVYLVPPDPDLPPSPISGEAPPDVPSRDASFHDLKRLDDSGDDEATPGKPHPARLRQRRASAPDVLSSANLMSLASMGGRSSSSSLRERPPPDPRYVRTDGRFSKQVGASLPSRPLTARCSYRMPHS